MTWNRASDKNLTKQEKMELNLSIVAVTTLKVAIILKVAMKKKVAEAAGRRPATIPTSTISRFSSLKTQSILRVLPEKLSYEQIFCFIVRTVFLRNFF